MIKKKFFVTIKLQNAFSSFICYLRLKLLRLGVAASVDVVVTAFPLLHFSIVLIIFILVGVSRPSMSVLELLLFLAFRALRYFV